MNLLIATLLLAGGPDCGADGGAACVAKGLKLVQATPPDYPGAVALWSAACAVGQSTGCFNVGVAHMQGKLGKADLKLAGVWFEKGCTMGKGDSCRNQAKMLFRTRNYGGSRMAYAKGCELKDGVSCTWTGDITESGLLGKPDPAKASEFYLQGCRLRHLDGCAHYGRLLDSLGKPKLTAEAHTLFVKACDGGSALGCNHLGTHYGRGAVVKRDFAKALELYTKACKGGVQVSCFNVAFMTYNGEGTTKNQPAAIGLWTRLCENNHGESCFRLSQLAEAGEGVPKDAQRATELAAKACKLGFRAACK